MSLLCPTDRTAAIEITKTVGGRKGYSNAHKRRVCYDKIQRSLREPGRYIMRIILDGMPQNHTSLPYLANNMKQFPHLLPMHLQGLIEHGQKSFFTMYRSFANLMDGANLAIQVVYFVLVVFRKSFLCK
jgi:hypothetical protein